MKLLIDFDDPALKFQVATIIRQQIEKMSAEEFDKLIGDIIEKKIERAIKERVKTIDAALNAFVANMPARVESQLKNEVIKLMPKQDQIAKALGDAAEQQIAKRLAQLMDQSAREIRAEMRRREEQNEQQEQTPAPESQSV